jgi:uncharacterized protein (TIGR00725 family)
MSRPLVAIVGGHSRNTTPQAEAFATEFGEALAQAGYGIICGGSDGIMEAACRGQKRAAGLTVGILKSNAHSEANNYIDVTVCTSMDVASNNIIIWSACAVVAFEGRYGTLNEVALALDFGKPLLMVGPSSLLQASNVNSPLFRHFPTYESTTIPDLLNTMRSMIRPRVRPLAMDGSAGEKA